MLTTGSAPARTGSVADGRASTTSSIQQLVYKAKMAQHAERYEEMVSYMKRVAESHKTVLNVEERNLLSVAYKKVVGTRRASWRLIFSLENKERQAVQSAKKEWEKEQGVQVPAIIPPTSSPPSDTKKLSRSTQLQQRLTTAQAQLTACHEYRLKIEHEVVQLCQEALSLLTNHLIPTINGDIAVAVPHMMEVAMNPTQGRPGLPPSRSLPSIAPPAFEESLQQQLTTFESKSHYLTTLGYGESLVFYYKMMGDYRRYLAEFSADSEQERISQSLHALGAYFVASHIAKTQLAPTHPIRLGLALNFSVFYYEVMAGPARACQIAKHAFDEALAELNDLSEDTYRDSTLIMQLLKDNLTLWTSSA